MSTPAHYPEGVYEPIKVIEAWGLGFSLGNVLKYIARAGKKGDEIDDLLKAVYYTKRALAQAIWTRWPEGSLIPEEDMPLFDTLRKHVEGL